MARRKNRLTDFILRLLGKGWDQRALPPQDPDPCPPAGAAGPQAGPRGRGSKAPAGRGPGPHPRRRGAPQASADPMGPGTASAPERASSPPGPQRAGNGSADATGAQAAGAGRARGAQPAPSAASSRSTAPAAPARSARSAGILGAQGASGTGRVLGGPEAIGDLDLDRVERTITGTMGYSVRRHDEDGHACLLGTWDDFPFVIEIPQGHDGWLLVSGDWQEPAPVSQRDEIAASANDWNRDKFFPTVGILDSPVGPRVRATYMMDMSSGITNSQLRLHLNTALSACTQALSAVGPLLPEI
ncbi:YbjN domain-containing protein [Actinomyces bowdenii]|uniref:YbjN domain-containing protein n=1 Tax=Actinomyces bowdenii TaxID=131109 RepID=A0A3P1V7P0_9ACTO|nr:YbjN domain-containing protein [Actinomyces bowdenii]MBO3724506.1 YbjN domain-containing protein [Actinomyces bowdenii]RRD29677.1 YbjN domain-containing protein [Actinomyces bowdenii]